MSRDKKDWEELGTRLREAREYRGFSQKEIGNYLGISRSAVSLIENGERKIDSMELKELAELYNTTIDRLVGNSEDSLERSDEVELLARAAQDLSSEDREEILRFAEFLRARQPENQGDD